MQDKILLTANTLALKFSDETNIPSRFKKSKRERSKSNLNSMIEQRFQKEISNWQKLISTMLNKVDNEKAWRFIHIQPNIETSLSSVTKSRDFCDFMDYLVLRRDKENCDSKELGNLCMLHSEFQREIERRLKKNKKVRA